MNGLRYQKLTESLLKVYLKGLLAAPGCKELKDCTHFLCGLHHEDRVRQLRSAPMLLQNHADFLAAAHHQQRHQHLATLLQALLYLILRLTIKYNELTYL